MAQHVQNPSQVVVYEEAERELFVSVFSVSVRKTNKRTPAKPLATNKLSLWPLFDHVDFEELIFFFYFFHESHLTREIGAVFFSCG